MMLSLLDPRLYIAIGILCLGAYVAGRAHQWRADERVNAAAALDASEQARETERLAGKARQGIEDAKNAEIRRIRGQLDAAVERLRNRPDRLPEASLAGGRCDGATGKELSRDDAAFLTRFAAERDEVAAKLEACQGYIREVVKP